MVMINLKINEIITYTIFSGPVKGKLLDLWKTALWFLNTFATKLCSLWISAWFRITFLKCCIADLAIHVNFYLSFRSRVSKAAIFEDPVHLSLQRTYRNVISKYGSWFACKDIAHALICPARTTYLWTLNSPYQHLAHHDIKKLIMVVRVWFD